MMSTKPSCFPVVAIGVSEDDQESLCLFLRHLPKTSGMAVVIALKQERLDLATFSELDRQITEVSDGLSLSPNQIFITRAGRGLRIIHDAFHLGPDTDDKQPIDTFLIGMANDMKERTVGVLLSGKGSDGLLGLKSVAEQAGLVVVQDPKAHIPNANLQN
ncbi:MAG: chemotaxis protein CheB, partial [Nitrosomonadales bacterium]|nr:chemotaxis protein CheB [Nitrosomonadales bacterium]